MRPPSWLLSTLLLLSCNGSARVSIEGGEAFGWARSATWLLGASTSMYSVRDGELHEEGEVSFTPLSISTRATSCAETQREIDRWGEASQDLLDADPEDRCDAERALDASGDLGDADDFDHASVLSAGPDDDIGELPSSGSSDAYASLGVVAGACEVRDNGCGGDIQECDASTYSAVEDAVLTIEGTPSKLLGVRGTLSGTLVTDEGSFPLEAAFDAVVCEIEVPEALVYIAEE